jgi:hypothetical protein
MIVTNSGIIKHIAFGNENRTNIVISWENNENPFVKNDVLLYQAVNGYTVTATRYVVINSVGYISVLKREDGGDMTPENIPAAGDALIKVSGNYVALKGSEGVIEVIEDGEAKVVIGKLQDNSYGLRAENAYIEGDVIAKQYAMKPTTLLFYDNGEGTACKKNGAGVNVIDDRVPMVEAENNRVTITIESENMNGAFVFLSSLDSVHDGADCRLEIWNKTKYSPTLYFGDESYTMCWIGDGDGKINGIECASGLTIVELVYIDALKNYVDNHSGLFIVNKTTYKL